MSKQAAIEKKSSPLRSTGLARGATRPGRCACGGVIARGGECESCRRKRPVVAGTSKRADARSVPAIVHEVLRENGRPLDPATREFMEPRFGYDLSRVRLHTGTQAAESARVVAARAYTVGQRIVFGADNFSPASDQGRRLLAHELAHTVQQRNAGGSLTSLRENSSLEANAADAGSEAARGKRVSQSLPTGELQLSRQADPAAERKKAIEEANAIIAEIEVTEKEDEAPRPAQTKKKPSPFSPGGFGDEAALQQLKDAQSRTKLLERALEFAEKQARRMEFWDRNPSYNSADVKEASDLDLYWDPKKNAFIRQPYVTSQGDVINADPEAKDAFDHHFADVRENKPVKESAFHATVGFVCRHTNPCKGNMEQIHSDVASGMSLEEARTHGMNRILTFGATAMLPGGPSGPVATPTPGVGLPESPTGDISEPGGSEPTAAPKNEPPAPTNESAAPKSEPVAPAPEPPVREATPDEVRAAYRKNPDSVQKSHGDKWHQYLWERAGGPPGKTAPIAFRTADGFFRVNEVRWLAVGDIAEINPASSLRRPGVDPAARPGGRAARVDPMGKTGEVVDPVGKTGAAVDPVGDPGAPVPPGSQTQGTPPPMPSAGPANMSPAGPRGYTPVTPEVVVEAHRINPHVVAISGSTKFHNIVWKAGGGVGTAPSAFRVGDLIRVDLETFPAAERAQIGYEMFLTHE